MTSKARLTKNQKERLLMLGDRCGSDRPGRWILDRDCGGPAALWHLFDKGFVEREFRYGPRGGEKDYYRPNEAGWAMYDKLREVTRYGKNGERSMSGGEMDTRLINARNAREVVLVYSGSATYARGVPGQVHRDEEGVLVLPIGQREIPLMKITKVVNEDGT